MSRKADKIDWGSRVRTVNWTVLVIVAYTLSTGPALTSLRAAGIRPQEPTYRLVEVGYAPVFYAHRHAGSLIRKAFDAYFCVFPLAGKNR